MAGPLISEKQEKFANLVALGRTYGDAYAEAGYLGRNGNKRGWTVAQAPRVRDRIQELKLDGKIDSGTSATKPWIQDRLIRVVTLGISEHEPEKRDLAAANRALELLARLGGYMVSLSYSEKVTRTPIQMRSQLRESLQGIPAELQREILKDAPEILEIEPEAESTEEVTQ